MNAIAMWAKGSLKMSAAQFDMCLVRTSAHWCTPVRTSAHQCAPAASQMIVAARPRLFHHDGDAKHSTNAGKISLLEPKRRLLKNDASVSVSGVVTDHVVQLPVNAIPIRP